MRKHLAWFVLLTLIAQNWAMAAMPCQMLLQNQIFAQKNTHNNISQNIQNHLQITILPCHQNLANQNNNQKLADQKIAKKQKSQHNQTDCNPICQKICHAGIALPHAITHLILVKPQVARALPWQPQIHAHRAENPFRPPIA